VNGVSYHRGVGSVFHTPRGDVWVSNGSAELIEQECAAEIRRAHVAAPAENRALAAAIANDLDERATTSGMGCYGFDVAEPPYDSPAARRVFAAALDALVPRALAADGAFDFLTRGNGPATEDNLRAYWVALLGRFAAMVRDEDPLPRDDDADDAFAHAVLAHRIDAEHDDVRGARVRGDRSLVGREVALAKRLLHHIERAGDAFSPHLAGDLAGARHALVATLRDDLAALTRSPPDQTSS
jgi:hypothetical protein